MEWIAIKDRLPTEDECEMNYGWFLVARESQLRPDISRYDGHDKDHSYIHGWKYPWDHDLTHWMHLPDMPE